MVCAACTADVPDEDAFCENCGVKLGPEEPGAPTCICGAAADEVDEDGFCLCCGRRVRRPASDHIEESLGTDFAAVSDRGLRHDHNEDRFAIVQAEAGCVLVVCDGVSATSNAEIASAAVSEAVANALRAALSAGELNDPGRIIAEAIGAGASELKAATGAEQADDSPSTTVVAALVLGSEITVGWVGDSRAYWIDAEGARLLTHDHSWINAVLASGEMTEEEAQAAPQAHAITRWLGADGEDASTPEVVQLRVETSGTLLLCTDGFWNYASTSEKIAELLKAKEETEALAIGRELVAFANEQGGRDNVTVALLRLYLPEVTQHVGG